MTTINVPALTFLFRSKSLYLQYCLKGHTIMTQNCLMKIRDTITSTSTSASDLEHRMLGDHAGRLNS